MGDARIALPDNGARPIRPGVAAGRQSGLGPGQGFRETTPTRERLCINGLWRWQPAADNALQVPTAAWGYYKVPACWPGIQDYMQSDYQTLYPDPSWKNTNLSEVQSAWYERTITIPQDWAGRRIALDVEYLNSYAEIYVDGRKVGRDPLPGRPGGPLRSGPSGRHACPQPAGGGDAAQSGDGVLQRHQHRQTEEGQQSNAAACAATSG